jgi:hypothetical protein
VIAGTAGCLQDFRRHTTLINFRRKTVLSLQVWGVCVDSCAREKQLLRNSPFAVLNTSLNLIIKNCTWIDCLLNNK